MRDVYQFSSAPIADVRGSFAELMRQSQLPGDIPSFAQANISRSRAGVLRGMHFHLRQWDLWSFIGGQARVSLVDLRAGLPTPAVFSTDFIPGDAVVIPPGVAHGFYATDDVTLLYLVTTEYDGTDEHSFRWNDADVALEWPTTGPVLSDRDAIAGSYRDALADYSSDLGRL